MNNPTDTTAVGGTSAMPLNGRVAVVTGAGQGIGRAIAMELKRQGAALLIADLNGEQTASTAEDLKRIGTAPVKTVVADLAFEAGARCLAAEAMGALGKIDILVNNAGGGVILPFLDHTEQTLELTIRRNLWTTIWCCQAVLPHMRERRYGRIINIGAESVRNGLWYHAAYNAAKGGVHGLTTGLAREFALHGITVNTVAPSGVDTAGPREAENAHRFPDFFKNMIGLIPMGRLATMDEVAAMVAYLASEQAAFVTGQVISVNGGSSML